MQFQIDYQNKVEKSIKILKNTGRIVKECLPELTVLINNLSYHEIPHKVKISTDGETIIYNPISLIDDYQKEGYQGIVNQFLHILFHLILGHLDQVSVYVHDEIRDLMADVEVHRIISGLLGEKMYANSNYSYFNLKEDEENLKKVQKLADEFVSDDHRYWKNGASEKIKQTQILIFGEVLSENALQRNRQINQLSKTLKDAGMRIEKRIGENAGTSCKTYLAKPGKKDWTKILKDILEKVIISYELPDSIDKNLYSYGFELYRDVAIIEPCEEENASISTRNITITIDTSASCDFDVAARFLGELEEILLALKIYMRPSDLITILECDVRIQNELLLEAKDIFHGCMKMKELHGFGGTDFIPVFERVCKEAQSNNDEKAVLIYLTDGYGRYPKERPTCKSFFFIPGSEAKNIHNGRTDIPDYVSTVFMEDTRE